MSERSGYIQGVPCWIDISPPNPQAEAQFYSDLFGWQIEDAMPEGSEGQYFIGRIRGGDVAGIGSAPDGEPSTRWDTYIWVDSADEAAAKARAAGGTSTDPFDVMDAGRMAVITDPEGATLSIWQPNQHRGSKIVNEHGSVNFNVLATRDLERAKAFYGDVFGWQTLQLPAGVMWTLPGYGDHLESFTPGLRKGMPQVARLRSTSSLCVPARISPVSIGRHPEPSVTPRTYVVTGGRSIGQLAYCRHGRIGPQG